MDVRRLLLMRTIARAGSLSAAARELGWTQPALTQHVQRLEREVGAPVFVRGPGGVTLTEAGERLLLRADAIAGELRLAEAEAADLAQRRSGTVRLAAFPSGAAVLLPPALAALAVDHPGVEVRLTEAEPPEAWQLVRSAEADLALVFGYGGPPREDGVLEWRLLHREPVLLVVPATHPAAQGPVDLAALAGEPWVGGCVRCRAHLVRVCRDAGFEPRLQHETDDYVVTQNLVARGLGVTMLPRSALQAYQHPDVVVRESAAFGDRHVGLAFRAGTDRVPAVAALLERLGQRTRQRPAPTRGTGR